MGAPGCAKSDYNPPAPKPKDTPESKVGERFFRDPRFSGFYYQQAHGNVNLRMKSGDPVLARMVGPRGNFQNPFQNQAMSCVACHMVDDAAKINGAGTRAYTDFTQRSPIPARDDGATTTPRRSPPLVGASIARGDVPFFLHWDGEFTSLEDLVKVSYTGRNFGWYPNERAQAVKNFANVVRNDDGQGELALALGGGSYSKLLSPIYKDQTPAALKIQDDFRLEVSSADDEAIFDAAAKLVAAYMRALEFSKDNEGQYNGSPYDVFLTKNNLPLKPDSGESDSDYAGRLSWGIAQLTHPLYVTERDGKFDTHEQDFEFGEKELTGLQIFLARSNVPNGKSAPFERVGNCVACHAPPNFTDFKFHNTGAAQEEYDAVHGSGAFVKVAVPNWGERLAKPEQFFGANELYPNAVGQFHVPPSADKPGYIDLGMWNVFGNPALPKPQAAMTGLLCGGEASCDPAALLPKAIALFKTPGLRDLGHSDPYLHTGRKKSLEDVLVFYIQMSAKTRASLMRNPDPELAKMDINFKDIEPLAAFLRSLNEDYN